MELSFKSVKSELFCKVAKESGYFNVIFTLDAIHSI